MASSKRLDAGVLAKLELDVPPDASRREVMKDAFDMHYVPLNEAYDYGERLADERGLSYVS